MAHLMKLPKHGQKGILLFTHKEIAKYNASLKQIRFEEINKITNKFFQPNKLKPYYAAKFAQLKEHYFLGQHFGWYHRDYVGVDEIDFYLATESTVGFKYPADPFRIPLSSSSFIHRAFRPKEYGLKIWDIITVTHNGKHKRMRDFVLAVRKAYDQGKRYKVLLLNKKNIKEPGKGFDNEVIDIYYELFDDIERQSFVLMRLSGDMSVMGMPSETVAQLLNLSKVFALFSEQEGEPRAVAEALICGLPVVTWKYIRAGGSIDHLNEKNSVRFETYEEAGYALIEAVENYADFEVDTEGLAQRLREDYTI
ncbi:MAG: hypothetical protein AAF597_14475, partial [Bacteroidota bacterium]